MLSGALTPMIMRRLSSEGQTVTLTQPLREEETEYNPLEGTVVAKAGLTETTCSVSALILDFALVSNGLQSKAGTVITVDDKECYIAPKTTSNTPFPKKLMPNDYIVMQDGRKYIIVTIKEYNPSGLEHIMFKLLLKRG